MSASHLQSVITSSSSLGCQGNSKAGRATPHLNADTGQETGDLPKNLQPH